MSRGVRLLILRQRPDVGVTSWVSIVYTFGHEPIKKRPHGRKLSSLRPHRTAEVMHRLQKALDVPSRQFLYFIPAGSLPKELPEIRPVGAAGLCSG
jgi:hypothetical protein